MAKSKRKRGRGPQLRRGPFTAGDIETALARDGWQREPGANHPQLRHPTKGGKVSISDKWTGIEASCPIFNNITRQADLSKKAFLRLLNGLDADAS